jgi:hypothetical protein
MVSKFRSLWAAIVASIMTIATPATAQVVTIGGVGVINNTGGQNGGSGDPAFGQGVGFLLQFDRSNAALLFSNANTRVYGLTSTSVATIGGHTLSPISGPHNVFLILSRGFGFFGAPMSEAVLNQTFQFSGTGGVTSPSLLAGGVTPTRDFLSFTTQFRNGTTLPGIEFADWRDPTGLLSSVTYRANLGLPTSPQGLASGQASLAIIRGIGAVPEPSTWAMLILGFGFIGAVMRRRVRPAARRAIA